MSQTRTVKERRKGEEAFVNNNRWQAVEISNLQNNTILLVYVYGHSGANDREDIREINETLLNEVFQTRNMYRKDVSIPTVGDLNTEWSSSNSIVEYEETDGTMR